MTKGQAKRIAKWKGIKMNGLGRGDACPICKREFHGGWGYDGCRHSYNDVDEFCDQKIHEARSA